MTESPDNFPATRWTLVEQLAGDDPQAANHALDALTSRYRRALYAYLLLARRYPPEEADDLVQGFLHDRVMRGNLMARARRTRGQFRTFLRVALDRYAIDLHRKAVTPRRSPGPGALISFEEASRPLDIADATVDPGDVYDLAWIRTVLEQTVEVVEQACREHGRERHWATFEARLLSPCLWGSAPEPYAALCRRLGWSSPVQAWNAQTTVRRMFAKALIEVVTDYMGDEEAARKEIEAMFTQLSRMTPIAKDTP